jgi:lipoprotein-releasing system permease protein
MVSKTNLKIALAHLTSRKKQVVVAILSVTFGVSMYIFMNGFMGGVNKSQTEMSFSSLAHIRVYNDVVSEIPNLIPDSETTLVHVRNARAIQYTEGIKNANKIIESLSENKQISAITSQINLSSTFRNGSVKLSGMISGIDVHNEEEMFKMKQNVIEGNWDDLSYSNNNIILGSGLAKKLSLKLHDNVTVITTDNITRNYKIVCLIEAGSPNIDDSKGFIKKSAALQLVSKNRNYATDIQINIPDYNKATEVAHTIKAGIPYKVESWQESSSQLVAANTLRKIIAIAVSLTIIIVAGFGIYNIMNMTVNEKIKEIAILKALGFDGNDVVQIFLTQAVIIGFIGGFTGVALGYGIASIVSMVPFEVGNMDTLPMVFNKPDYIIAFAAGIMITIIAGYLPAKKASMVDPVEIIRG